MADEEAALRLKTLAEQNYTSNNLNSAFDLAQRAHKLHPSLDGLPELLAAFRILTTAAAPVFPNSTTPDYYKILDVERFANTGAIKKQYRKLALTLHPDKSPFSASGEAFKFVAEAMGVLSNKSKRKEYDTRLRVAMQAEVVVVGEEEEVFRASCSSCGACREYERKYLGHDLVCASCKMSFKAVEVDKGCENVEVEKMPIRVSARIQKRAFGILGKSDKGLKRKIGGVEGVSECLGVEVVEDMGSKGVEVVGNVEGDSGGVTVHRRKKKAVSMDGSGSCESDLVNSNLEKDEGVEEGRRGGVSRERMKSGRTNKRKDTEEEFMTLAQMQVLTKKRKVKEGKCVVKEKEVDKNLEANDKGEEEGREEKETEEIDKEKEKRDDVQRVDGVEEDGEDDEVLIASMKKNRLRVSKNKSLKVAKRKLKSVMDLGAERPKAYERNDTDVLLVEEDREMGQERLDNGGLRASKNANMESLPVEKEAEKITANTRGERERRRVSKYSSLEFLKDWTPESDSDSEIDELRLLKRGNLESTPVEKEIKKTMVNTREKRERRRVSKYSSLEFVKQQTPESDSDSEIVRHRLLKRGNLEVMPVGDSDFHDFDKDRTGRSFKKGQVWAVYDDKDGMPRHYALVDRVVSVNPFEVILSWVEFQSNGDDELMSREKLGFRISCGRFVVTRTVSVKYLNLFSHMVDCERAAREVYIIYPKKGSVWALYADNNLSAEGNDLMIKDKQCYDVVLSLSSYSDVYGLSIAFLEKVDGFRTVFKRKEVGAHAVVLLGRDGMKLFSHQIPAKKLSGQEASGLPKDCWELDPASLTP